jgi:hypothetical protein
MLRITACLVLLTLVNACASPPRSATAIGSEHRHRFQQPPEKAARCFAHNAEEHSSALMSEVRVKADGSAEVIVRVKNGVLYASAEINRAGNASTGTIHLMVRTSRGSGDLLEALVEGC